jgi:hypothetical protein
VADVVHQVSDPVASHDRGRILQLQRLRQGTSGEERPPRAEDHRDLVDDHLVDEPELERLASDLTRRHVNIPVAGKLLGSRDGLLNVIDESERCGAGILPVRRRLMGDDEDMFPAAGLPFQPFVMSNSRRPITTVAILR